ncbi:MAG: hypothetical protein AB4058_06280, partial [Microcystaceae cyanobacterium]
FSSSSTIKNDANVAFSQGDLANGRQLMKQEVDAGRKCQNLIVEQENQESEEDWGIAEQNAYERLSEESSQNVPAGEFLEWLTELEEGKDV